MRSVVKRYTMHKVTNWLHRECSSTFETFCTWTEKGKRNTTKMYIVGALKLKKYQSSSSEWFILFFLYFAVFASNVNRFSCLFHSLSIVLHNQTWTLTKVKNFSYSSFYFLFLFFFFIWLKHAIEFTLSRIRFLFLSFHFLFHWFVQ